MRDVLAETDRRWNRRLETEVNHPHTFGKLKAKNRLERRAVKSMTSSLKKITAFITPTRRIVTIETDYVRIIYRRVAKLEIKTEEIITTKTVGSNTVFQLRVYCCVRRLHDGCGRTDAPNGTLPREVDQRGPLWWPHRCEASAEYDDDGRVVHASKVNTTKPFKWIVHGGRSFKIRSRSVDFAHSAGTGQQRRRAAAL